MPKQNSIAKNTVLLYVRTFVSMIVGFITARVVLEALGQVDYGVYSVVGSVVGALTFLNGSLSASTSRYLTVAIGKGKQEVVDQTFSAALNMHLALGLVLAIILETGGVWFLYHKLNIPASQLHAAFWVLQFSIISMIIGFTSVPYGAALISHENMGVYAYMSLGDAAFRLAIAYTIKWVGGHVLVLYAGLGLGASVVMQIIYRAYALRYYPECRFRWVKDKALYKSMLSYSGWDLFGNCAVMCQTSGLNVLMNIFFGPIVNTARALSGSIQNAVVAFVGGFTTASRPRVIKYAAVENYKDMYALTFKTAKVAYFLFFMLALPVFIEVHFLLTAWLGHNYPPETPLYTRLILGTAMVSTLHSCYLMCFHGIGKIRLGNLINGILMILTLPASWLAFKCGAASYWGLAIPLIVNALCHCIGWFIVHSYAPFPLCELLSSVYVPILCVSALSCVAPAFLEAGMSPGWVRLICVAAASEAVFLPCAYFIGFTRTERKDYVNPVIERAWHKIFKRKTT